MLGCGISVSWLGFPARAVASYRSLASLRFHHKSTARRERAWTYHHSRETSATSSFSPRAELGAFAFSLQRSCARGPNPPSSVRPSELLKRAGLSDENLLTTIWSNQLVQRARVLFIPFEDHGAALRARELVPCPPIPRGGHVTHHQVRK